MAGTPVWRGVTIGLILALMCTALGTRESQAQIAPEPQVQSTPEAQPQVAPEPPAGDVKHYFSGQFGSSQIWVTPSTGTKTGSDFYAMGEYQWVHKDRFGIVPFVRIHLGTGFEYGAALRFFFENGFYIGGGLTHNMYQTYFPHNAPCTELFGDCRHVQYHIEGAGNIFSVGKIIEDNIYIQLNYQHMPQEYVEYRSYSSRAAILRETVPYSRVDLSLGFRFQVIL